MKKALIIILSVLGGVFLLLAGLVVLVLVVAKDSGSKRQEAFFKAVGSGQTRQVIELLDPRTMEEIDEPVLAAWMQQVSKSLGAYKGLSTADFNTSTETSNGVTRTTSKGTVNFEKGQAQSELVYQDDKIIKFHVQSPQMGNDWFKGPADATLYRQRAKAFLTALAGGKAKDAFDMMHPNLQQQMPLEKLTTLSANIAKAMGKVTAVPFKSDTFEIVEGDQTLTLLGEIHGENGVLDARIRFKFIGLRGYLLGFNVAARQSQAAE